MAAPVPDLADYLPGRGSVERALRDGERRGRFAGEATFALDGDGLLWDEHGEVALGDHVGPARRRLRLVRSDDAWEVRFEDGRPFHRLDLSAGRWSAGHDCRADRYDGAFEVLGGDAFDIAWEVHGPAKDQRIVSRYRRR